MCVLFPLCGICFLGVRLMRYIGENAKFGCHKHDVGS